MTPGDPSPPSPATTALALFCLAACGLGAVSLVVHQGSAARVVVEGEYLAPEPSVSPFPPPPPPPVESSPALAAGSSPALPWPPAPASSADTAAIPYGSQPAIETVAVPARRCGGLTLRGAHCRRRITHPTGLCPQHRRGPTSAEGPGGTVTPHGGGPAQAPEGAVAAWRCEGLTGRGQRCRRSTTHPSRRCPQHRQARAWNNSGAPFPDTAEHDPGQAQAVLLPEPSGAPGTAPPSSDTPICLGITASGERCRRRTRSPSGYCPQHQGFGQ